MGIKVALLINEYFGAIGTGFGNYGFLARRLFAKYIKEIHSISRFTKDMREVLFSAAKKD